MKGEPLTSATHPEVIAWVDKHAGLEKLCQRGGWPDGASLRIDVCSRSEHEWIVDIYFEEVLQEMSECEPTREERYGQFSLTFDAAGSPPIHPPAVPHVTPKG